LIKGREKYITRRLRKRATTKNQNIVITNTCKIIYHIPHIKKRSKSNIPQVFKEKIG
jgi:hypothetical protein